MAKEEGAFLTIGELARELGVAQHVLRYWETRFPQLRPLQRSGNRRYYRPRDVEIASKINRLLNEEGFTVRGAQRLLSGRGGATAARGTASAGPPVSPGPATPSVVAGPPAASKPQGELPIGDTSAPTAPETRQGVRMTGQIGGSDIALLIARLTVIRQTLHDALEGS